MNANELADKLKNVGWDKPFTNWELLDEAAILLRKQQAEIEELSVLCVEFNILRKAQENEPQP